MGEVTTRDLVAQLADAYPRGAVTPDTLRAYLRSLSDLRCDILERAILELIRTSKFLPAISEIREMAAELTLDLPREPQALEQIEARVAWARESEETRPEPPPIDPLVREALDHVGGWHAFRASDEPGIVRSQFLRLYRDLRAARIREIQVGTPALTFKPLEGLTA